MALAIASTNWILSSNERIPYTFSAPSPQKAPLRTYADADSMFGEKSYPTMKAIGKRLLLCHIKAEDFILRHLNSCRRTIDLDVISTANSMELCHNKPLYIYILYVIRVLEYWSSIQVRAAQGYRAADFVGQKLF